MPKLAVENARNAADPPATIGVVLLMRKLLELHVRLPGPRKWTSHVPFAVEIDVAVTNAIPPAETTATVDPPLLVTVNSCDELLLNQKVVPD